MKKLFLALTLAAMAAANTAYADTDAQPADSAANTTTAAVTAKPASNLFWGLGVASIAPPLTGFGSVYAVGWGGSANIGFTLDKNWALLAMLDGYSFATNAIGYSSTEFTLTPDVKYSFDAKGFTPYLFAGAGLNDNISNAPSGSVSTVSFAYNGGAGVAFNLGAGLDLQIQAEYESAVTANGSFSYLPLTAGVEFN